MAGWVTDAELEAARAIDDGRPFLELAREAGHEPDRWRESIRALDDLEIRQVPFQRLHRQQGRLPERAQHVEILDRGATHSKHGLAHQYGEHTKRPPAR